MVGTLPAKVITDIGKLMEEEMTFPHPWDVPTPLLLALPGEDTRRGPGPLELCASEPGKRQAAARSDASLSIHVGISYL